MAKRKTQTEGYMSVIQKAKPPKLFYLQCVTRGYVGNSPVFWRKGGGGYTPNIDDAEQFTAERVREIKRSTHGSHVWRRWPVKATDAIAHRVVDMEDYEQVKRN